MRIIAAIAVIVTMTAAAMPAPAASLTPAQEQEIERILKALSVILEPYQGRVILGVDCTKPFVISLPGNVLTECEAVSASPRVAG